MKNNKPDKKGRKKKFVKLPVYPGGSAYFKRFIYDNLIYPEEALAKGIEGSVYVSYTVDDMGVVIEARVTRGLGYGCDEEALRLIRLLRYEKVKNRGVIVKSNMRARIDFHLKNKNTGGLQVTYQPKQSDKMTDAGKKQEPTAVKYHYTISVPPSRDHNNRS
jgi:TonB family protein